MKIIPTSSRDQVLGVMVDGRELKIAHLAKQGAEIAILNLETVSLHHRLGKIKTPATLTSNPAEEAGKDIFGFEEAAQKTEAMFESPTEEGDVSSLLINAFGKYLEQRIPLAVNVPEGQATYYSFESNFGLKGKKLRQRLREEISPLAGGSLDRAMLDCFQSASGALNAVVSEGSIPFIDELMEVRNFLPTPPVIRSVSANEIALVNLTRMSLELKPDEITALIYVGSDFSRIIMLRGDQPISFLQTIREGYQTPQICQTLFSKILLEQEEAGLSEVHQIALTGEVGVPHAHDFFTKQFPEARVHLVTPGILNTQLITAEQIAIFPNYAIPVALAWEVLDRKDPRFIRMDLVPQSLREGQRSFKVAWHGFALLGAIFGLMLLLSYQGLSRWSHIRSLDKSISRHQKEIELLQPDLTYIGQLQAQISDYSQNLNFMDSLIVDPGKWSRLFGKLMHDFKSVNQIWIENIKSDSGGFTMVGKTLFRNRVPKLADCLPRTDLKRVTRVISENGEVTYEYELTAGIPAPDTTRSISPFPPGTDRVNTAGGGIAEETASILLEPQTQPIPGMAASQLPSAESAPASNSGKAAETAPASEISAEPEAAPNPAVTAETPGLASGAKKIYTDGIDLVHAGDIAGAKKAFSSLLERYPDVRQAAAARYWLGECRYAEGNYASAIEDFAASLDYETNTKREAALLMLGLTYLKLGQDDKAKAQFEALLEEFPNGEYTQKARGFVQHLSTQG